MRRDYPQGRESARDSRRGAAPASRARAPRDRSRRPAPARSGARTSPSGSKRLACRIGLKMRLGRVSTPVPATHCQLPLLLAMSPSTSRSRKCAAPRRQSRREVLGQEGAGEQPRPVVHPALARELPHAGVDDREAGAPSFQAARAAGSSRQPRPRGRKSRARRLGARGEQLRVEVAPAELPHERLRALAAPRALDQLERREAAEVQVRAEPRRAVGGEVVVAAGRSARARARASAPARRRPSVSPPCGSAGRPSPREIGERRSRPARERRRARDPPRSCASGRCGASCQRRQ